MKDKLSEERLLKLHPKAQATFKKFIEEAEAGLNITLRISQGLRTIKEQDDLYAQGRTKPGKIVTNAKSLESFHNFSLAIDLVELIGKDVNWNFDYKKLEKYSKENGLEWGGTWKFKDNPHFQLTFGLTIKQLKEKYLKKDFIKGTEYINI